MSEEIDEICWKNRCELKSSDVIFFQRKFNQNIKIKWLESIKKR